MAGGCDLVRAAAAGEDGAGVAARTASIGYGKEDLLWDSSGDKKCRWK